MGGVAITPAATSGKGLDMADRPTDPDSRLETGMPRWVKVFGIVALVVVVLVVILLLAGGHGPGRHA